MNKQNLSLRPKQKIVLLISLALTGAAAFADLDSSQSQGLSDTKHLLTTPSERNAFIKKDKGAADVDAKLEALTGKAGKEDVYGLSSQIMERIVTETNGDPVKMQTLLNEAQKNPEAFYNKYFSAEQKAKVKGIADKSSAPRHPSSPD